MSFSFPPKEYSFPTTDSPGTTNPSTPSYQYQMANNEPYEGPDTTGSIDLDEIQRRLTVKERRIHESHETPIGGSRQTNPHIAAQSVSTYSFPAAGNTTSGTESSSRLSPACPTPPVPSRKGLSIELKTPLEYALHMMFTQFVRLAERKLEADTSLSLLRSGVDPAFDKVILALGYIAKKQLVPVVESIMYWRIAKNEQVDAAIKTYNKHKHAKALAQLRSQGAPHSRSALSALKATDDEDTERARALYARADLRAQAAAFLACRVFVEVVRQLPTSAISSAFYSTFEENVYGQLKSAEPSKILAGGARLENWIGLCRLVGEFSVKRFLRILDRFIADLEKMPLGMLRTVEHSMALLVRGMRALKLANYPLEEFEESCGFLALVAKFFYKTTNPQLINAYCETLADLLLPLCGVLSAETDLPAWSDVIKLMLKKINTIIDKPRHWEYGFSLMCVCLLVSPANIFTENWFDLIEYNLNSRLHKNPPRESNDYAAFAVLVHEKPLSATVSNRVTLMKAVARLLWTYIFRCPESLNKTTKKLDRLFKTLFFGGAKKNWMTYDSVLLKPVVVLLRSIGYSNINYTMELLLLPLIHMSPVANLENMQPEKLLVVLKAYIFMLSDVIANVRPAYPTDSEIESALETPALDFNTTNVREALSQKNVAQSDILYHEELLNYFCALFLALDSALSSSATSTTTLPLFRKPPFLQYFNLDASAAARRALCLDLFEQLVLLIPWFYQLLEVIPYPRLVETLARNCLHENSAIASASSETLRRLCSKTNSGVLITTFAKYAFGFEVDPQRDILATDDYERLLKTYLDLLAAWLAFLKGSGAQERKTEGDDFYILNGNFKMSMAAKKQDKSDLDVNAIASAVEQVEGNGLFFLCLRSTLVRRCAVTILKMVPKFDDVIANASGKKRESPTRLIKVLEAVPFFEVLSQLKLQLSMPERKKLASLKQRNRNDQLVKLSEADYGVELTLWFKVFPKVLLIIFEKLPVAMALCRLTVCLRLVQMHEYVSELAERKGKLAPNAQSEVLIEQWKLFLIVACTFLTQTQSQEAQGTISLARSVFKLVIPLLKTEQPLVTDAIHSGLSCININIFTALVDVVQPIRRNWETEIQAGSVNESNMRLRVEVTRILHATLKFLQDALICTNKHVLTEMILFVKTVRLFLGALVVQELFDYQKLRRYFCGLLENVYLGIQKTEKPDFYFPFEARLGCFTFLEEWCGYGGSAGVARKRYAAMRRKKHSNNPAFSAAMELESTALEYSAVSAMATLCLGAIRQTVKGNKAYVVMAIDYNALASWIRALFDTEDEIIHRLGRRALKNLLALNKEPQLFEHAISECYKAISSPNIRTSQSYFATICDTLLADKTYNCNVGEVLVLALFAAQLSLLESRRNAGKLLVYTESRFLGGLSHSASVVDLLSLGSRFVYSRAAVGLLATFALLWSDRHPVDRYSVFLIFCKYLYRISPDSQKNALALMAPWARYLDLRDDDASEMVLCNLFEITERSGDIYYAEVEALWSALIRGSSPHASAVVDFVVRVLLLRRSTSVVEILKKIVSFVQALCPAVVDTLLRSINPKAMIPPDIDTEGKPPLSASKRFPYVYTLPEAQSRDIFSLGQVTLIFLVDVLKSLLDPETTVLNLPMLLNISIVLLDHYVVVVRDHAIELLCTILQTLAPDDQDASTVVESLRKRDAKAIWSYDDLTNDGKGARTPANMDALIRTSLAALSPHYSGLQQVWSRTTLTWATACLVRHIACRLFQAFRALLCYLDKLMLRDMLHRLLNTILDQALDIQGFAMQILMSLNATTAELGAAQLISFPELFWSAVACLHTIHEKEFVEVLLILQKFILKIDLNLDDTIGCLILTFPPNWEGKFEGLQMVVMIGLRLATAWEPSLALLDRLNKLRLSDVIAGPQRLLLALLANLPRFLHALEEKEITPEIQEAAQILHEMAVAEKYPSFLRIVLLLANNKFRKKEDFIMQLLTFVKEHFFPKYQLQCLVFLLGLLMNKIRWVKLETLELLKCLFPMIDLTREEFQGVGADLLSPVLRLLLTDFSEQALEVLDETDRISGSELDKDFIRLSLGNRTLRKEYEKIATIFGVPEDSGWLIPMLAVTAATTRNNVHAVYLTCRKGAVSEKVEEELFEEPVRFYDELPEKRSILNMYATLNYFESFFETDGDLKGEEVYHDRSSLNDTTSKFSAMINENLDRTESGGLYRLDPYNSNNYNNYIN